MIHSPGSPAGVPKILAQSAVPVVMPPNGTVAANGQITLGTALPVIYAGAWVYLPANAIVGGAAGLYWAEFSTTLVGTVRTVFADPSTQFVPYVPTGTLVAAVGSASAYTQPTGSDITVVTIKVAGGSMGANGGIRVMDVGSVSASANTKLLQWKLGGATGAFIYRPLTTNTSIQNLQVIRNRGVQNRQIAFVPGQGSSLGSIAAAHAYPAIDTSVDKDLTCTFNLPAADAGVAFAVLEAFSAELLSA